MSPMLNAALKTPANVFRRLQDHAFLARVALAVVTLVGFLHLLLFLAREIVDVWNKFHDL